MRIAKDIYLVGGGDIRLSNPSDCHIYLVDGGRERCLIDAGVGLDHHLILENIRQDGFSPKRDIDYILITHAHSDHGGGAKLMRQATGAKVIAPLGEAVFIEEGGEDLEFGLRVTKKSGVYPPSYVYGHTRVDKVVRHNERVKVGSYTFRVIQVPGHSHATAGYLGEQRPRSFFSSDIVFINGTVGLGNWPGSNLDNYRNSIGRLRNLEVASLFPGHFMWTLKDGQTHLDQAIENFTQAWVPPAWTHLHPHR
jgi:glyoxylase-like metal-dependent hydrolase (beta-lactamase superfamily II)